jgi:hypothetical protein
MMKNILRVEGARKKSTGYGESQLENGAVQNPYRVCMECQYLFKANPNWLYKS